MSSSPICIGVLGAAAIVPMALTNPARSMPEVQVLAIAARDPKRAHAFARKHHIPRVHQTYSDLLSDPEIDAIYNPLPNSLHAEWTIRALRAGKHVLCEKPLASNACEAEQMARAAQQTGLVLSEAFAYRYHPLTSRVKEIVSNGQLGTIRHIEAQFCFLLPSTNNIRFNYELAGGALMDMMRRLNEERGATFVFSTHDPMVMERAKRVIRLRDGRIEADERRPT